ncbi:STAS/SEC14 domain-containing protein [Neisseriaceae bacterium ESL0693]|nr:STAS/SEC14 domain-containing protein [Neisseriaceae bacterium ESL0693]
MISIREQSYGLNVVLYNEFTLDDFCLLEQALLQSSQHVHRPDLLLDLSLMTDFTIDMAFEQLRFLRQHADDFGRTAIVVNDIWIQLGARIGNLLTLQHARYFSDNANAQKWLLDRNSIDPKKS